MTPEASVETIERCEWNPPSNQTGFEHLPAPDEPVIFQNGAVGATTPGVTRPTTFELDGHYILTQFMTYHYGARKPSGAIGLRHADGTMYGPWQAAGAVGQGNVPNAYWYAQPRITLKPGHYTVVDSDPATWVWEACTTGAGCVILWGRRRHDHDHD
jgi:hypothetical protein